MPCAHPARQGSGCSCAQHGTAAALLFPHPILPSPLSSFCLCQSREPSEGLPASGPSPTQAPGSRPGHQGSPCSCRSSGLLSSLVFQPARIHSMQPNSQNVPKSHIPKHGRAGTDGSASRPWTGAGLTHLQPRHVDSTRERPGKHKDSWEVASV